MKKPKSPEITKAEEAIQKLEHDRDNDPRLPPIISKRDAAKATAHKLDNEINKIKNEYSDRIWKARRQLSDAHQAARDTVPKPPERLRLAIEKTIKGTTTVLEAVAWNEDGTRAILKWPGHKFWNGIGNPQAYSPTEYFLVDTEGLEKNQNRGITSAKHDPEAVKADCKGRLSPATKAAWMAWINGGKEP